MTPNTDRILCHERESAFPKSESAPSSGVSGHVPWPGSHCHMYGSRAPDVTVSDAASGNVTFAIGFSSSHVHTKRAQCPESCRQRSYHATALELSRNLTNSRSSHVHWWCTDGSANGAAHWCEACRNFHARADFRSYGFGRAHRPELPSLPGATAHATHTYVTQLSSQSLMLRKHVDCSSASWPHRGVPIAAFPRTFRSHHDGPDKAWPGRVKSARCRTYGPAQYMRLMSDRIADCALEFPSSLALGAEQNQAPGSPCTSGLRPPTLSRLDQGDSHSVLD